MNIHREVKTIGSDKKLEGFQFRFLFLNLLKPALLKLFESEAVTSLKKNKKLELKKDRKKMNYWIDIKHEIVSGKTNVFFLFALKQICVYPKSTSLN